MRFRNHRGVAIIAVVLASALLSALALSVTIVMTTETQASAHHAASREALYAAEGAIAIAAQSLLLYTDWNDVIAGAALSPFNDGPPGMRRLADGTMMSLPAATDSANATPRPWGANNPRWALFGFGWLGPSMYVVAWVADDPMENDGDPARDGSDPSTNPGSGIVAIRAEAFGPSAAHKVLEATVRRYVNGSGETSMQMLSWNEIR